MLNTVTLTAGQRIEFREPGDFFRVLAATAAITVEFYENGREIAEAVGVGAGYAEKFDLGQFDRIAITSATAQTIQFVTRLGNTVQYDAPPTGSVSVTNTGGAFTQAAATVTTTAANLLAAKSNRRYLLIQNKDAAGIIYVNLAGAAATVAAGLKIDPGGSLEIDNYCPTGAISAIGSIASNANVVVVEA